MNDLEDHLRRTTLNRNSSISTSTVLRPQTQQDCQTLTPRNRRSIFAARTSKSPPQGKKSQNGKEDGCDSSTTWRSSPECQETQQSEFGQLLSAFDVSEKFPRIPALEEICFNSVTSCVCVVDSSHQGKIVSVNEAFQLLVGIHEKILGLKLSRFIKIHSPPSDLAVSMPQKVVLSDGVMVTVCGKLVSCVVSRGQEVPVSVWSCPVKSSNRPSLVACVIAIVLPLYSKLYLDKNQDKVVDEDSISSANDSNCSPIPCLSGNSTGLIVVGSDGTILSCDEPFFKIYLEQGNMEKLHLSEFLSEIVKVSSTTKVVSPVSSFNTSLNHSELFHSSVHSSGGRKTASSKHQVLSSVGDISYLKESCSVLEDPGKDVPTGLILPARCFLPSLVFDEEESVCEQEAAPCDEALAVNERREEDADKKFEGEDKSIDNPEQVCSDEISIGNEKGKIDKGEQVAVDKEEMIEVNKEERKEVDKEEMIEVTKEEMIEVNNEKRKEMNKGEMIEVNKEERKEVDKEEMIEVNKEKRKEVNKEEMIEVNKEKRKEVNKEEMIEVNKEKRKEVNKEEMIEVNKEKRKEVDKEQMIEFNKEKRKEMNKGEMIEFNKEKRKEVDKEEMIEVTKEERKEEMIEVNKEKRKEVDKEEMIEVTKEEMIEVTKEEMIEFNKEKRKEMIEVNKGERKEVNKGEMVETGKHEKDQIDTNHELSTESGQRLDGRANEKKVKEFFQVSEEICYTSNERSTAIMKEDTADEERTNEEFEPMSSHIHLMKIGWMEKDNGDGKKSGELEPCEESLLESRIRKDDGREIKETDGCVKLSKEVQHDGIAGENERGKKDKKEENINESNGSTELQMCIKVLIENESVNENNKDGREFVDVKTIPRYKEMTESEQTGYKERMNRSLQIKEKLHYEKRCVENRMENEENKAVKSETETIACDKKLVQKDMTVESDKNEFETIRQCERLDGSRNEEVDDEVDMEEIGESGKVLQNTSCDKVSVENVWRKEVVEEMITELERFPHGEAESPSTKPGRLIRCRHQDLGVPMTSTPCKRMIQNDRFDDDVDDNDIENDDASEDDTENTDDGTVEMTNGIYSAKFCFAFGEYVNIIFKLGCVSLANNERRYCFWISIPEDEDYSHKYRNDDDEGDDEEEEEEEEESEEEEEDDDRDIDESNVEEMNSKYHEKTIYDNSVCEEVDDERLLKIEQCVEKQMQNDMNEMPKEKRVSQLQVVSVNGRDAQRGDISLGQLISDQAGLNQSLNASAEEDVLDLEQAVLGSFCDHYRICETLGHGSFGFVRRAVPLSLNLNSVVVKFIKKSCIYKGGWQPRKCTGQPKNGQDEGGGQENDEPPVPTEVSILQGLDHCNIIKALDVFQNDHFVQFVMEDFADVDLFDFIDTVDIDELLACHIFKQIVQGVDYLHSNSVVHLDIKDENVIINPAFHCKLIDFGSASYFLPPGQYFSKFRGTMQYCSPEVHLGQGYRGPEVDAWALGVTLYTVIFRENPYSDDCVPYAIKFQDLPFPVSEDCLTVLFGLLECDIVKRFSAAKALASTWLKQTTNPANCKWKELLDHGHGVEY